MVRLPLPPAEINNVIQKRKRDCGKYTVQANEVEFGMCLQLWFCAGLGQEHCAGALSRELHPPPLGESCPAARAVPGVRLALFLPLSSTSLQAGLEQSPA